jgi:hypothetical protein
MPATTAVVLAGAVAYGIASGPLDERCQRGPRGRQRVTPSTTLGEDLGSMLGMGGSGTGGSGSGSGIGGGSGGKGGWGGNGSSAWGMTAPPRVESG